MWLVIQTDANVAVLTAGICWLGCYVLTCLCEQFRLCALGQHVSKILSQKGLFFLMTMSLGGVSVYSMNFLNLAAISVGLPATDLYEAHQAPIQFKVGPMAVSVFVSCIFAFLGLYVASKDPMFAKTKKEIVEGFIEGAKEMSLKEVKSISSFKLFYVISTKSLGYLIGGGLLAGGGAACTACLTMWSLAIPDILLIWNAGILVAGGLFSCFFSIVAFWILFRLMSLYPRKEILRIASAMFMSFCFVLTHFICMKAIRVRSMPGMAMDDSEQYTGRHHLGQPKGFIIILVSVVVFCFLLLVISVVDLRSWLYESSNVVHKHEAMLLRLKGMHSDNFAIIAKHMRECELQRSHHSSNNNNGSRVHSTHSLLEGSVSAASKATSLLSKYLPLMRGKVAPRADVVSSCSASSSQAMPTPRPITANRSGRVASSKVSESAIGSTCEPLELARLPELTDAAVTASAVAVVSIPDLECGALNQ